MGLFGSSFLVGLSFDQFFSTGLNIIQNLIGFVSEWMVTSLTSVLHNRLITSSMTKKWHLIYLGYCSVIDVEDPQKDKSQTTGFSFSSVKATDVVVALAHALDYLVCPMTIFVDTSAIELN